MLEKDLQEFSENINALRDFVKVIEGFLLKKWEEDIQSHAVGLLPIMAALEATTNFKNLDGVQDDVSRNDTEKNEKLQKKFKELYGEDIQVKIKKDEKEDISVGIKIPASAHDLFSKAMRSVKISGKRDELLYQNSLLNLIGIGEWFLSQILRLYFSKFPDAVGGDEKFFSLQDLKEIGSIEEAKKCLLDSKIENIMRGSFEDWVKFFKQHVKLSMKYLESEEKKIKEIFQRRNLLMHNGGVVNAIYFSKVSPELREGR